MVIIPSAGSAVGLKNQTNTTNDKQRYQENRKTFPDIAKEASHVIKHRQRSRRMYGSSLFPFTFTVLRNGKSLTRKQSTKMQFFGCVVCTSPKMFERARYYITRPALSDPGIGCRAYKVKYVQHVSDHRPLYLLLSPSLCIP